MLSIEMGDYVICKLAKKDSRFFERIKKVKDIWGFPEKYIIADTFYLENEIDLAYKNEILNLMFTIKDNEFIQLKVPTVEKPWYIIHMSKCTLSGQVDMGQKEEKESIIFTSFQGEVSAEIVKQLRGRSRRGIMECKKALQETKGDLVKAEKLLKTRR